MKTNILYFAIPLGMIVLLYFAISFMLLELNPVCWSEVWRCKFALSVIVFILFGTFFANIIIDEDEEDKS